MATTILWKACTRCGIRHAPPKNDACPRGSASKRRRSREYSSGLKSLDEKNGDTNADRAIPKKK